jgi:hypothetical protein
MEVSSSTQDDTSIMAEGEGFEPPLDIKPKAVFKTATFNHSAIPP